MIFEEKFPGLTELWLKPNLSLEKPIIFEPEETARRIVMLRQLQRCISKTCLDKKKVKELIDELSGKYFTGSYENHCVEEFCSSLKEELGVRQMKSISFSTIAQMIKKSRTDGGNPDVLLIGRPDSTFLKVGELEIEIPDKTGAWGFTNIPTVCNIMGIDVKVCDDLPENMAYLVDSKHYVALEIEPEGVSPVQSVQDNVLSKMVNILNDDNVEVIDAEKPFKLEKRTLEGQVDYLRNQVAINCAKVDKLEREKKPVLNGVEQVLAWELEIKLLRTRIKDFKGEKE